MAAGLGFKDFTTGEVLTAADVDGYLMQGIWVFASAAARDAAVTSPQEGNFAFLKDTNTTTYYTGSAWTNLDTTGMVNPMTTTGDTIYASSGSTPARLGIGSTGQVLTVSGGLPSWATPASSSSGLVLINKTDFSATSSVNLNDVFSTTYDNYKIMVRVKTATSQVAITARMRVSGSDTSTNYQSIRVYAYDGTTSVVSELNTAGTDEGYLGAIDQQLDTNILTYDVFSPFLTAATTWTGTTFERTNLFWSSISWMQTDSTSFTGFSLLCSQNITGSVFTYGYAKA